MKMNEMPDREKVIARLEEAMLLSETANECKVTLGYGTVEDALAMLKAQEPVEPIIDTHWETPSVYDDDVKVTENKCGACGAEIDKWDKYCRVCGRAVKWE